MLSVCVSIFSTLVVSSLVRAFSLFLVRSLLSFLAVSGPHLFGSVARTSEMVSVRVHDGNNKLTGEKLTPGCPEFEFIIPPPAEVTTHRTPAPPLLPMKKKDVK